MLAIKWHFKLWWKWYQRLLLNPHHQEGGVCWSWVMWREVEAFTRVKIW
jgi:hypothetical protein